jgi:hypothetical protein
MWRRVDIVLTDHGFSYYSSTLKMEAICSSETSVNTISTRRHIPENCFLHIHRRENLKSYIIVTVFWVESPVMWWIDTEFQDVTFQNTGILTDKIV